MWSHGIRTHVAVVAGPDTGRRVLIEEKGIVIGTAREAALLLTDDSVSGMHLELMLTENGIRARDLGSANGTWLGAARIYDATLTTTTALRIGDTELMVRLEDRAPSVPPSANRRFGDALAESVAMRQLFTVLERAAPEEVSLLLEGESGVGKDVLARAIHAHSKRANGPFVALDCGAIPTSLIESELFGHERGAFTGADQKRDGAFVAAHGGTLFLDEIGELPLDMQPKLLRALEAREVRPVGGRTARQVDIRIVAATNRNLSKAVQSETFRRDLYYRIAGLRAVVPPLRERTDDILPLARSFLQRIPGLEGATLEPELEARLLSHPWPGNVRELKNVIGRYAVLGESQDDLFGDFGDFGAPLARAFEDLMHLPYREARAIALTRFERAYLPGVLARAGNVVIRAAKHAGVERGSFHRMLVRIRPGSPAGEGVRTRHK